MRKDVFFSKFRKKSKFKKSVFKGEKVKNKFFFRFSVNFLKKKKFFFLVFGQKLKQKRKWKKGPFLSIPPKALGGGYYETSCTTEKCNCIPKRIVKASL